MSAAGGTMERMRDDGRITFHLLKRPEDLLPWCGTWPGRDPESGEFHAVRVLDEVLEALSLGMGCCVTCMSPESLGGWSPMALEEGL
ncbi:hypothetical protein [Gordonia sp. DT101]|uniref:hypothetical protein n=1 Tax=Gordonia sp. DT101 TaxID=3416545 RepID=UPI003CF0FB75